MSHPCYEGHFPGQPVLPGVVLLDLVVSAIGRTPLRIASVKFLRALTPGESFTLQWQEEAGRVTFRCVRGAASVAEGVFTCGDAP